MTFFLASFDVKKYQFALFMLNFLIVVWGSEFERLSHSIRYLRDCLWNPIINRAVEKGKLV